MGRVDDVRLVVMGNMCRTSHTGPDLQSSSRGECSSDPNLIEMQTDRQSLPKHTNYPKIEQIIPAM